MLPQKQLDRLIHAVGQGDRDALKKLYDTAAPAVYAYALSIVGNPHDAQDVLQDCFVTVLRNAGQYRSQERAMAWIITITRNLCYKLLQQQKRYISLDEEGSWIADLSDPDDRLLIESCMKRLTQQEQQIVILHAVAGCSHRQIAEMFDLKLSTVLSKYHRALGKLRAQL